MPGKTRSKSGQDKTCLILASGSRLQYRTLRCAAEYFDTVYVLGTSEARPLGRSRACEAFFEAPVSRERFHDLQPDAVNRLCADLRVGYILPSDSATTRYLTTAKDHLTALSYPVPSTEVFDVLDNKFLFSELCKTLEISCPRSRLAADEAALVNMARSGDVRSPSVAKPLSMAGSVGVTKLVWTSPEELLGQIDYDPILVQDYIQGTDISAFFLCRSGRDIAWVIYRKDSDQIEFLDMPPVLSACRIINRHIEYDGVIGFDIRVRADGSFAFLECNPRFWYNMHIAQLAGLNFVRLGFDTSQWSEAAVSVKGVSVANLPAVLRKALARRSLDSLDRKVLRYFGSDILSNLLMWRQKYSRAGRVADGHSL